MHRHPYLTVWVVCFLLFCALPLVPQENGHVPWLWAPVLILGTLAIYAAPIISLRIWWRRHKQKRGAKKAILARCEYEHAALMRGDTITGIYGRFTPTVPVDGYIT